MNCSKVSFTFRAFNHILSRFPSPKLYLFCLKDISPWRWAKGKRGNGDTCKSVDNKLKKKNKEAYSLVSSFCLILCVGICALDKAAASASLEGLALYTETLMLNIAYFLDVLKPL